MRTPRSPPEMLFLPATNSEQTLYPFAQDLADIVDRCYDYKSYGLEPILEDGAELTTFYNRCYQKVKRDEAAALAERDAKPPQFLQYVPPVLVLQRKRLILE